jgi:hypothetical protein
MVVDGIYITAGTGITKITQKRNGKMKKDYNGYDNGEKARLGPSFQRGGYEKYNWCSKCYGIWDKTHTWCNECKIRLRGKGRYMSRREYEIRQR